MQIRRGKTTKQGSSIPSNIRFVVGIDEAGRGPLAGPVSVGAVVMKIDGNTAAGRGNTGRLSHPLFLGVKNSKALTEAMREEWYAKICTAQKEGTLGHAVSLVHSKIIDKKGIAPAIRAAVQRSLNKLGVPPHETFIFLDGSLYAPEHFLFQKTIIKGDELIPIIGLASICAKVVRDRKMVRLARQYPEFGFEIHKGYGTAVHRQKIQEYGPSEVHRHTFLRSISK